MGATAKIAPARLFVTKETCAIKFAPRRPNSSANTECAHPTLRMYAKACGPPTTHEAPHPSLQRRRSCAGASRAAFQPAILNLLPGLHAPTVHGMPVFSVRILDFHSWRMSSATSSTSFATRGSNPSSSSIAVVNGRKRSVDWDAWMSSRI